MRMSKIENDEKDSNSINAEKKNEQQTSKICVETTNLDTANKKHHKTSSSLTNSPRLQRALTKPSRNCLCSPTTHVGSFRCRIHRNLGGMIRGYSVGSSLSELATKSHSIRDLV